MTLQYSLIWAEDKSNNQFNIIITQDMIKLTNYVKASAYTLSKSIDDKYLTYNSYAYLQKRWCTWTVYVLPEGQTISIILYLNYL